MTSGPPGHLIFSGPIYDAIFRDRAEDLAFYLKQAEEFGDPVLELACGTGRITLPLAQAGHRVVGIDVSESMLAVAREKAVAQKLKVKWIRGDAREFELQQKFPLILFPFATIGVLLKTADLEACLACVKRHLKKGGRFIFDALNPSMAILNRNPQDRFPHSQFPDPGGAGVVTITESNSYDSATQVSRVTLYFKFPGQTDETLDEINIRMYYPQELEALLKYNGFRVDARFGDFDETPFASTSNRQIIICTRQAVR